MRKDVPVFVFALCLVATFSSCLPKEKKDPVKEKVEYFQNKEIAYDDYEAQKQLNEELAEYVVSLTPEEKRKFAEYSDMTTDEVVELASITLGYEVKDPVLEMVENFFNKAMHIAEDDYEAQQKLNDEIAKYYSSLNSEEQTRFANYLMQMQNVADEQLQVECEDTDGVNDTGYVVDDVKPF